ncbi:unnamed protein product, partial [Hydatigera taeniaeformis]|uniref:Ovule protein n=1 Tax=Hydatigena taeniaeformis TaxID=6205 RepID=A0A0R3XAN4_HYDTA
FAEADVENAPPVSWNNAALLFPLSSRLTSTLPKSQFTVEGKFIVTTAAVAAEELSENDSHKVEDWLKLVRSTGTMRINCCH